eukprot:tig00000169_g11875.t1
MVASALPAVAGSLQRPVAVAVKQANGSASPPRNRPAADLGRVAAAGVALIKSSLSGYSDTYVSRELSLISDAVTAFFAEAATRAQTRAREVESQLERSQAAIHELVSVLGVEESALASSDVGQFIDVRARLAEEELEGLRRAREERRAQLGALQGRIFGLLSEFGAPDEARANYASLDSDLSQRRVDFFGKSLEQLQAEREARQDEVRAMAGQLQGVLEELDAHSDLLEHPVEKAARGPDGAAAAAAETGVSDAGLLALRALVAKWRRERSNRAFYMEGLAAKIRAMWESLDVPGARRDAFLERAAAAPLAFATLQAHEEELGALEAEQKARLAGLIAEARRELEARWDEMALEEAARRKFEEAYCGPGDESTLEAVRQEAARCEAMLKRMRPIFELMERREALEGMREEYLALTSQPERLTSKARRHDLIAEERLRTAVERHLPRLKAKLAAAVERWEAEHGCFFVINGRRYLDAMREEEAAEQRAREEARSHRARRASALPPWEPGPGRDRMPGRGAGSSGGGSSGAATTPTTPSRALLSRSLDFSSRPSSSPPPSCPPRPAPPRPPRPRLTLPVAPAAADGEPWGPAPASPEPNIPRGAAGLGASSGELARGPRAGIGGRSSGLFDWERSWRSANSPVDDDM